MLQSDEKTSNLISSLGGEHPNVQLLNVFGFFIFSGTKSSVALV